ncbi:hypothetical protein ABK040_013035 [Willaertia magna]
MSLGGAFEGTKEAAEKGTDRNDHQHCFINDGKRNSSKRKTFEEPVKEKKRTYYFITFLAFLVLVVCVILGFATKESQNQLDQTQLQIKYLTNIIEALEEKVAELSRITQTANKWTPVNITEIGSISFSTLGIQIFKIPLNVIPKEAKEILINYTFRSGNENEGWVNVWLWTEDEEGLQYKFLKKSYRYPQSAISFDNENIWVPFFNLKPHIYVTVDHLETRNCHGATISVLGYR